MPLYLADIRQEMEKFPRKTKDYPILKVKKLESVGFRGLKSIIFKAIVQGETDNYRTAIQFFDVDYSDIKDDTFTEDVGIDGTEYYYHKPRVSRNPVHIKCTCFTGDTLIPLANGKSVPIKDLVGLKEFFVYSFDKQSSKIVIGKGYNCEVKDTNSELVEVELDNGHKIKCTPDHKFLLKDGTWREAKDLSHGDSLEPLYRKLSSREEFQKGYEQIYQSNKWEFTHQLSDKYNLQQEVYPSSQGQVRHVKLKTDISNPLYNHKVVKVNRLVHREDVYCFTVEEHHNFVIDVDGGKEMSSGVVVSNCMDFRMRWEKQLYDNAGLIGNWTRYTRKTPPPPIGRPYVNPQNILGFCKHLDSLKNALRNSGRITN